MSKKITLYHIADELGISASTVSRVLNNSNLISDKKSDLIIKKAKEMGYVPRKIKKQKSRVILNILLFLHPSRESFIHLFYDVAQLLEGIKKGFGHVSVNILTQLNDGDNSFLIKKKTGQIDGCIFAFTRIKDDLREELLERDIPFIHLNRKDISSFITYDSKDAMGLLIRKLYQKRGDALKPCYLGFGKLPEVNRERYEGIYETCLKNGIPFSSKDSFSINDLDELKRVFPSIINGHYNGVLAFNDILAMAFLQRARENKIEIPKSLSLTGFDNSPVQQLETMKISTVDFSISLLGTKAAQWLSQYIIDKNKSNCQEILKGQYIKGDTI